MKCRARRLCPDCVSYMRLPLFGFVPTASCPRPPPPPTLQDGLCPDGDDCSMAHSEYEMKNHPLVLLRQLQTPSTVHR